jgi:putative restriction endonuclease
MAYCMAMRYWWANQTSAYDAEVAGGYLWSRKRRANGTRNPFYESVRLTQPGDIIFGYQGPAIRAVGFVLEPVAEAPRPTASRSETPDASRESTSGWLISVAWLELQRPLIPALYMSILGPLLPSFNAPLTARGRGIQGGRLMEVPPRLANALLQLAGGRDPAQLLRPSWNTHQLRFAFAEPASTESSSPPPDRQAD